MFHSIWPFWHVNKITHLQRIIWGRALFIGFGVEAELQLSRLNGSIHGTKVQTSCTFQKRHGKGKGKAHQSPWSCCWGWSWRLVRWSQKSADSSLGRHLSREKQTGTLFDYSRWQELGAASHCTVEDYSTRIIHPTLRWKPFFVLLFYLVRLKTPELKCK